jgi:hypothetical protein
MRAARQGVLDQGRQPWPPGVRVVDRGDAVAEIYDGVLLMSYQVADTPVLRLRPVPFDDHQPR